MEIDGLRIVAIIGVLYVHFWNKNHGMEHLRVSLFFVISGFVITMTLLKAKDGPGNVNIRNFYTRRALLLFSALFVARVLTWSASGQAFCGTWRNFRMFISCCKKTGRLELPRICGASISSSSSM